MEQQQHSYQSRNGRQELKKEILQENFFQVLSNMHGCLALVPFQADNWCCTHKKMPHLFREKETTQYTTKYDTNCNLVKCKREKNKQAYKKKNGENGKSQRHPTHGTIQFRRK